MKSTIYILQFAVGMALIFGKNKINPMANKLRK